jgi:glycosyltransferase involved in cell wall biosynthesis
MPPREVYDWVVLNQSQSPAFQQMLENVAGEARTLLVTGAPHASKNPTFRVEAAASYDRRGLARRAASWLAFASTAGARLLRLGGKPFVFTTTNPPILPHLAWALCKARGWPYGILVWDIFPHALIQAGWFTPSHPLPRIWSALNRRALREAEVVIALGSRMADVIRAELGKDAAILRVEIIPNWGPTEEIRPIGKADNPFAREHGLTDCLCVMYSGNLGRTHGLEPLVGAAHLMRDDERVRFVIIGDGLGRPAVERSLAEKRLDKVLLLGMQPWEAVRYSLAAADIAVVSQAPGAELNSLPSKVYWALAAGSAILAVTSEASDLADLVRENQVGCVVPWGDEQRIAQRIDELANDPSRLRKLQANARRTAEQRFSPSVVEQKFRQTLGPFLARERR